MKINLSKQSFKALENNNQDFTSLKIGQLIKTKINKVKNDGLIIELGNGKLLYAKTTFPMNYNENQVVQFRVKEINENQLIIQPIQERLNKDETTERKIISILKEFDIKPEKEKIELVKKLIVNKIPVSKENIIKIANSKVDFERVETLFNSKAIEINEKILNDDIRKVLKNLLKVEFDSGDLKNSNKQTNFKNINIKNVNFEKIIFLLKNKLTINISNITNLNNLLMKDFTVTKQTEELINLLYKNDQTMHLAKGVEALSLKIKNMIFKKTFKPQEVIKEMHIKIELIKQVVENIDSKERNQILNSITNLKNSLDFINKLNEFQTYMQIPIVLNDEKKNLDLLISKKDRNKKKIDPKDVKILVEINTKNMDKVKVLIEIKEKNIICNFKVTTEKIQKKISKFEKYLKDALILLGYEQINMRYAVVEDRNIVFDFNDENLNEINTINLKV
ncbi:hypothetical protein FQB35_07815 [Crassaminicella thermophila]|uniref:Hook-length control protein FliK n=1 Tax=Crassaminicella thermophila TaxID=2599308 RepID=A0A5C0SH36_CRATE|nr:hypothetical protein [Crassaminicella thermophila]QEK12289.1 hypothetical protein FQB35_07815 [Crassaminicella thermophila]